MALRFEYPEAFEQFWEAYPSRISNGKQTKGIKSVAFTEWKKAGFHKKDNDELIDIVRQRAAEDIAWLDRTFIPDACRFIKHRRWEDDYQQVAAQNIPMNTGRAKF